MARAFIGIGSNLGDAAASVRAAIARIGAFGEVEAVSSLYRTAPWGRTDQPPFVNAAAALRTRLEPHALLRALKAAEHELGRVPGERWGPRAIDLDILAYEGVRIESEELTIPHPRLEERAFALIPLAEIAAEYALLRDRLGDAELAGVEPLVD